MRFDERVSLANYSTMGLGGDAAFLTEVIEPEQVAEAWTWAKARQLPVIMIGGGSNIVWKDEGFNGLVIINRISGYELKDNLLEIGSGENWDSVVARSVEAGLTGIEALSLVPGTAGGTPVQNVGAYGQEISQTLVRVKAYDTKAERFVTITDSDCDFSYRNSRFKSTDRGRFFITSLTLKLKKANPQAPFYGQVQAWFDDNNITEPAPQDLRQAVVAIRSAKLPDPAQVKNTGSFFANPIVSRVRFEELAKANPGLPNWPSGEKYKLSAAWLIEQAGFKDYHDQETGMSTWPTQPLVLVNEHAKSTADLLAFKKVITDKVRSQFEIELVQEPELLP